jgi:hypothetical protein
MKFYRLFYLAVMLLLFPFSCEMVEGDEELAKYNEAQPATVTIKDIPSSAFGPDTVIYIRFYDSGLSVQGNVPVGVDGSAVIDMHLPTGVPYKVVRPVKTTLFILQNNKTKMPLYRTIREIELETHTTNIVLSFTSDFTVVLE